MSWQNSIYFEKGEKLVASWEGNRETTELNVNPRSNYGGQYIKIPKKAFLH
jgi:hypothetical protein